MCFGGSGWRRGAGGVSPALRELRGAVSTDCGVASQPRLLRERAQARPLLLATLLPLGWFTAPASMSQVSCVGSSLSHQRPPRLSWGLNDSLRDHFWGPFRRGASKSHNHRLSTPPARCVQFDSAHDLAWRLLQSAESLSWARVPALPGLSASSLAPSRPARPPR